MVNAPTSPSEVTVLPLAGKAWEGSRRQSPPASRLRETRMAGLQACLGCCRAGVQRSWRAGASRRAAGGAALRFAGCAACFCQSSFRSAPPTPPDLRRARRGIVPEVGREWERTWGTLAPLSFVVGRLRGFHRRLPQNPGAWGGKLLGSRASEAVLFRGPTSCLRPL